MDRLKLLLAERPEANFNILPRDALLPRLVMDGASKQALSLVNVWLTHSLISQYLTFILTSILTSIALSAQGQQEREREQKTQKRHSHSPRGAGVGKNPCSIATSGLPRWPIVAGLERFQFHIVRLSSARIRVTAIYMWKKY
jgi:hypothetical protein